MIRPKQIKKKLFNIMQKLKQLDRGDVKLGPDFQKILGKT